MSQVTAAAQTASSQSPAELSGALGPIDDIRPRLRHDVVFADTGMGAFVRNTETGFLMRGKSAYRWLSTLAPHFNGELTVGELCEGLADDRRILITSMVRTLLERGFAKHAVEGEPTGLSDEVLERFGRQVAFIDHYTDNAARRFEIYRTANVLLVGTGETTRAAQDALLRNGSERVTVVPPEQMGALDSYDLVVVCADEVGPHVVARACAEPASDRPAVLPVMTLGRKVLLGPLTRRAASPCWHCLLLRLHANSEPADMAQLWRDIATGGHTSPQLPSATVAQIVGNAIAFDVFRLLTGALIGESAGAVLVQDMDTIESTRERLLPHPACPQCHGDGPQAAVGPYPDEASFDPASQTPQELHERMLTLVREHVGIVRDFTDRALPQSPLKVARCRAGASRELVAFDIEMLLNAREAVLRAAVLSYVDEIGDLRRALPASEVPGDLKVGPAQLRLSAGVPAADGPYLPASDLLSQQSFWVPAAAVYPFGQANPAGAFEPTVAGRAAALMVEQADEAGLLSALCFEGLRGAVSGDALPEIDLAAQADEQIRFLVATAANLSTQIKVYGLPKAAPAQAVIAVGTDSQGRVRWTAGSALRRTDAVITALRDLVGLVQMAENGDEADLGGELLADFEPACLRSGGADTATAECASPADLLQALNANGVRALRVQTTTPDLELVGVISTVRVLLAVS